MRLASTIQVYGGGVGSGCKGPNCGRPQLEEGEYYHGTSASTAKKILRGGIKTSHGFVSTTDNKGEALFHGRRHAENSNGKGGDDIALVVVKHPDFREGKDATEYSVPFNIGPETIQRVEYYRYKDVNPHSSTFYSHNSDIDPYRVYKKK